MYGNEIRLLARKKDKTSGKNPQEYSQYEVGRSYITNDSVRDMAMQEVIAIDMRRQRLQWYEQIYRRVREKVNQVRKVRIFL